MKDVNALFEVIVSFKNGPAILERFTNIESAYDCYCDAITTKSVDVSFIRKIVPNDEFESFTMTILNAWSRDDQEEKEYNYDKFANQLKEMFDSAKNDDQTSDSDIKA